MSEVDKLKDAVFELEVVPTKAEVKMLDGSIYKIDDKFWLKALDMKLQAEELDFRKFKEVFSKIVKKHWTDKTVPTKFGWDDSWEEYFQDEYNEYDSFSNMAELADVVCYVYIRAYVMGIVLSTMSEGSKVIALSDVDVTVIDDKGAKKYDDLDDVEEL